MKFTPTKEPNMTAKTNIVRTFQSTEFPCWEFVVYAKPSKIAARQINGVGISPGFDNLQDAVQWIKAQTAPEPMVWETRESYQDRTGLTITSESWTKLIALTVERKNGDA